MSTNHESEVTDRKEGISVRPKGRPRGHTMDRDEARSRELGSQDWKWSARWDNAQESGEKAGVPGSCASSGLVVWHRSGSRAQRVRLW